MRLTLASIARQNIKFNFFRIIDMDLTDGANIEQCIAVKGVAIFLDTFHIVFERRHSWAKNRDIGLVGLQL